MVLCGKRCTLLLVNSSDCDLLCFGGDEDSFTKLCSFSSTPQVMGVVVGSKIYHEKTKSFCPAILQVVFSLAYALIHAVPSLGTLSTWNNW